MLLSVRIIDIIDQRAPLSNPLTPPPAQAQAEEPAEENAEEDDGTQLNEADGDEEDGETGPTYSERPSDIQDSASRFTETEVDILKRLAERRKKLEKWEENLKAKENILNITQNRIEEKISELRKLKLSVETSLKEYNEKEDRKIGTLVKIYENMKAKNAAEIFSELETETLLQVIKRMKEKNIAPILAQMDPKLARDITEKFASRGKIKRQ